MKELVARLRDLISTDDDTTYELGHEAADAIERLEADAKRLDWMDKNGKSKVFSIVDNWYTRADYGQPYKKHKSLRDAIDAAMYKNGEKVDTSEPTCIEGHPV